VTTILRTRTGGFLMIGLLLLVWEVVARSGVLATVAFPPFSRVFETFWNLLATGQIAGLLAPSLERLFIGYFFALMIGVTCGFCARFRLPRTFPSLSCSSASATR
jgi:ABC-type nitrate/sulfonate/bicarbonate transport system permease component